MDWFKETSQDGRGASNSGQPSAPLGMGTKFWWGRELCHQGLVNARALEV